MRITVKYTLRFLLIVLTFQFLSGCHYEEGRWYLGKSDIVTLPDFRGEFDKLNDCLVANEVVTIEVFNKRFDEEYKRVTTDDNWRYWGYLVCLALDEYADQKQIGKTVVFLTDRVEPGNHAHTDLEAMSILLKKKLDQLNEKEFLQQQIKEEKKKNMMQKVEFEMESLAQKKKIKELNDQVRKLKEIEVLLENKSKQ